MVGPEVGGSPDSEDEMYVCVCCVNLTLSVQAVFQRIRFIPFPFFL